jgi:hypothetical protein
MLTWFNVGADFVPSLLHRKVATVRAPNGGLASQTALQACVGAYVYSE